MSFEGQIALVTGASRGIGRAIGLAFARVGAYVIVNYRGNEAAAQESLAAIEAAGGHGELCQFDVAEESRLEALHYFYANDLGPIRNTDHYFLPGGGGLRGYADRAILGDRLFALDLEAQDDAYPVRAFAGVARVRSYVPEDLTDLFPRDYRTYSEAGLGFSYGPVQLDFPFWLGTPDPGESPWKVRWRFTFLPIKLPRL